ncbi:hypothetical protein [Sphingomonas abaci]|uniref:Uncharacterized protein n=1 Tax=Sphingomonas abaci TaxID=237611 RepID=A0A7W7AK34_9SPHN|nr:hypothetical protein [Sphingomonas abaci]MBB4618501.1 hypothetical protein [Sphingomonas abaci]
MSAVNLWAETMLLLRPANDGTGSRRIDRGRLSEMVCRALAWDEAERDRLYIQYVGSAEMIPFGNMAMLARRSDFPITI